MNIHFTNTNHILYRKGNASIVFFEIGNIICNHAQQIKHQLVLRIAVDVSIIDDCWYDVQNR